jgi:UDP-glucose:(glucosyl)LPS alpha-1,2-glucosyltransferase
MTDCTSLRLASLLPRRERYALSGAGAISTVVDGFAQHSAFRKTLTVLGSPVDIPLQGGAFLPVHPAPWWQGSKTRRYLLGAAQWLKNNADFVEIHNRPKYVPLIRKRLPHTALALYLHNDPRTMEGMKTKEGRRKIGSQADAMICVSNYIRGCFLEGVDDLGAKTFVVRNAVDTEVFCPTGGDKRKEIIFAGRTIYDKGPHLLVDAAEKILPDYPDWKVVIVGGRYFGESKAEKYEKELFERMRCLGLQGEVTGYLPRHELLSRWQQATIAVLPALWEDPISLVAMEAAACGCAVITTRRGGIPEGLGDAAMYLPDETPQALESLLRCLLDTPPLLREWQNKARDHVIHNSDARAGALQLDDVRRQIYASTMQTRK